MEKFVSSLEEKLNDTLALPKYARLNELMAEHEKLLYRKGQLQKVRVSGIFEECRPLKKHTEVAGAGFINIFISKTFIAEEISKLVRLGFTLPPPLRKLKVIVDMSSPNIAKEMHVGHLRSTIIGESVSRLLIFLGHDILKLNHLGDWGTQFGMLIAHLHDTFKDLGDQPLPVSDLQTFYKASKKRFDEDEEFKKRAYEAVVKLQAHDPLYIRDWQKICDISKREFDEIYRRMDIKDLVPRGESFYQSRMESLVAELKSKNLLENDDGRQIPQLRNPVFLLPIFTFDSPLYFRKKFKTRSGTTIKLVDLLNEGVERSLNKLKEKGRDKVTYPGLYRFVFEGRGEGCQAINGGPHRCQRRLRSVLSLPPFQHALSLYHPHSCQELTPEEQQTAAEAVAYGCIKYADLAHNRNNDYIFSFDKVSGRDLTSAVVTVQ
ncbi:unnamed protein product [Dibothriocephalus latus]|uniref:Arginyl-tRNA synthetase n=1 Tax=Dibothriocephalus latus TaxID=60516 RepID=A0A3P7L9C6_DIBLA|nr:unnamed protein product [Dibothriocephalus latus]